MVRSAIVALALAVATAGVAHSAASPQWLHLHVGMRAFTADDGEDATMLTVCPGFSHLAGGGESPPCVRRARGIGVFVERILPAPKGDREDDSPVVALRAVDGFWSGYARASGLQPAVPLGTTLALVSLPSAPLQLAAHERDPSDSGIALGARVLATLLGYHPESPERALFVRVQNGTHAGATGWVYASFAETVGGLSIEELRWSDR